MVAEGGELETNLLQASQRIPASSEVLEEVFGTHRGPSQQLSPQHDQLMSQRRILCLKPALGLEWRGQYDESKAQERKHRALTLCDSRC